MEIVLSPKAVSDLTQWRQAGEISLLKKARKLIAAIQDKPYDGIGKPEPFKNQYSGYWSRRVSREHRLVYEVSGNQIIIHNFKGHYE